FTNSETGWEVPVLKVLLTNLYYLSLEFQRVNQGKENANECLEDASRIILRFFTTCLSDKSGIRLSKRKGLLLTMNFLFSIYFKLNNLRLCNNIIRAFQLQSEISLLDYPKSEQILFRYLYGKILLNQHNYKEAEVHLEYAYRHCNKSSMKNKREILIYLLVIKVMHGVKPTDQLLLKYNLSIHFFKLIKAIFEGNVQLFEEAIAENIQFYIKKEIYLLIQMQMKDILYRNLFKKIYIVISKSTNMEYRLPIKSIVFILRQLNIPAADLDSIECKIATMINNGFIRGYISHEKSMVVLSKKNSFPSI
ncbi:hypothetical protein ROZALSC1DRAFT_725, partial [Rozella allomycis CSF55]